jgi:hypothetical protein
MSTTYPFLIKLSSPPYVTKQGGSLVNLDALDFTFSQRVEGADYYPVIVPTSYKIKYGEGFNTVEEALETKLEPKKDGMTEAIASKMISRDFFIGKSTAVELPDGRKVVMWGVHKAPKKNTIWATMYSYIFTDNSGSQLEKFVPHPQMNILAYWI